MRPRCGVSLRRGAGRRRGESGIGPAGGRVAVGLTIVAIVVLVAAASASASSLSVDKAGIGDSPRLVTHLGPKQAASSASGSRLLDGIIASADPTGQTIVAASVDAFYDGFEGASPPWQMEGNPTWGYTTYRAAAGTWSAYCARSAIAPPGPYANNMQAWIETGPIDLSTATEAALEYKFYLNCEAGFDGLVVGVSLNGTDYYAVDAGYTGAWDWTTKNADLTAVPTLGNVCGQSTVYVAFLFESDESGVGEGAYVDEVRVSKTQVTPTAAITSLTPNHGLTGATVVIAGSNLGSGGVVRFGTTSATTSAWSATSVTCTVPDGLTPGAVNVTVTPTAGAVSNALSFTVDEPPSLRLASWTISGQPLTVNYKGKVTISGTLSDYDTGTPLANRHAELYWTYDPTDYDSWQLVGATDSPTGLFSIWVTGLVDRRTYFSWWFDGDAEYWWESSDDVMIMARAQLARPGFALRVRHGVKVSAIGTMLPRHSAAQNRVSHTKVEIYRYSSGKYRPLTSLWAKAYNTATATKYSVSCVFHKAGKYRARAIHQDADHAKTTSSWRYFTVL